MSDLWGLHTAAEGKREPFNPLDDYYFPGYDYGSGYGGEIDDDDATQVDMANSWLIGEGSTRRKPHLQRGVEQGPAHPDAPLTDTERWLQNTGHEFAKRIHQAEPNPDHIYRGMAVPPEWIEKARQDGSITLPLSSFSPYAFMAHDYSRPDPDRGWAARKGHGVILKVEPGSKSHPINDDENVSHGDFDVLGMHQLTDDESVNEYEEEPDGIPRTVIHVRQRSVPAPVNPTHTASTDGIRYAHIVDADVAEDLRRLAGVRTAAHEHVESGQRGRPDWTGCAHPECRPDLPTTMYHVSHPKNRDSIARHGLLTSYSEDDDFSDELGMPHGIYMTSDEPKPSHDTERWPGDVWAIDTTRLRHLENDFPGGMLFRNAFATKYDVPPEAMRLHRPSAHHTARLAMPSRDAYDDTVMNSKRKTDDIPEQGEFYHGSNHEHQPGDILESVRARGDSDRLDYYERSVGAPNHADWVWMYNHPAPATKYHKNVYQLEPLDEGPWIWNNIKRDDGQFRPTENDQDFPRLVSPRARVIRKLTPDEHAAAGQHLNEIYDRYRAERDARTSRLAAHPKRPTNWPPDGGWQPRDEGDGMMTLYHRTSPENADEIIKGQRFLPGKKFYPNEPDKWQYPPTSDQTWFATSPQGRTTGGYDERGYEKYGPAVVKVRVPKEKVYYPAEWFGVKPGDDVHAYVYPEDLDGLPITRHATTKTAMPAPLPKGVYFRYHPELMWSPGVTAHLPGGKQVGSLEWYDDDHVMVDLGSRKPGEIDRIGVHPDHQGQSIATSMFDFAKQYEPRLHHSETLTEDGRGWSAYEKNRTAGKNGPPPPMTYEPFNTMWTNGIMARHAEDGRPLAHLHWYPDGEIETIRVHPEMRGRGVGKEILTHAAAHPETYEAEDGIKPSNNLTPDGRAFARSLGHNPSDEEVTPAEGEHEWAWKAVQNYVPMHIPYTGQNEDEMSRYLDKPWTSTKTAASGDGWPVWWRGRQRPAVPFDKRWHPNHPEHVPGPWES